MKKRFRKRFKKRFRKRFKFSRQMRVKGASFDVLKTKCSIVSECAQVLAGPGYCIAWGDFSVTTQGTNVYPANSDKFINFTILFQEYRITGLKIRLIHPVLTGSSTNNQPTFYEYLESWSSLTNVTGLAVNQQQRTSAIDYKVHSAGQDIKLYKNVGKYFAKNNPTQKWMFTNGTGTVSAPNYYVPTKTMISINVANMATGQFLPPVFVTYYCVFRGPIST